MRARQLLPRSTKRGKDPCSQTPVEPNNSHELRSPVRRELGVLYIDNRLEFNCVLPRSAPAYLRFLLLHVSEKDRGKQDPCSIVQYRSQHKSVEVAFG